MNALRLTRDQIDDLRLRLLRDQLQSAADNVPFYSRYFKERDVHPGKFSDISDLKKLPVITKAIIQQDPDQFINTRYPVDKYHRSFSSGSTGEPFRSLFDRNSWYRKKYYSKLRARHQCGMCLGDRVAIFEAASGEKLARKNRLQKWLRLPYHVQLFSIFEDVESTLENVAKFNPQNFYGPPGYLFHLAQLSQQKKTIPNKLERIFTASEYLSKNVRDFLQQTFQVPVFDHYGNTELKEVAWQCQQQDGYHINEDEVICEILKGQKVVADGEVGDIVLTDLRNRAMPFIRYRIGDRGMMLKEPCSCGLKFKLMRPVAGRDSDYIVLRDGQSVSPYMLTTAIEDVPGLLKYQFIQINKMMLLVKIVTDKGKQNTAVKLIEDNLQHVLDNGLEMKIQICDQIPIEGNGKFKVVYNEIEKNHKGSI